MRFGSAVLLASFIALLPIDSPSFSAAPSPPEVLAVRSAVTAVDKLVAGKKLRTAKLTIGGGQNPSQYTLHYQGGSDRDYERDPYAAPFVLRRLRREITLPAVGDAAATLYFSAHGKLLFAHTTGADTMGVTDYALTPASQLRVYYREGGDVVRAIFSGGSEGQADQTVDVAVEKDARRKARAIRAGAALRRRAEALLQAFGTIAR